MGVTNYREKKRFSLQPVFLFLSLFLSPGTFPMPSDLASLWSHGNNNAHILPFSGLHLHSQAFTTMATFPASKSTHSVKLQVSLCSEICLFTCFCSKCLPSKQLEGVVWSTTPPHSCQCPAGEHHTWDHSLTWHSGTTLSPQVAKLLPEGMASSPTLAHGPQGSQHSLLKWPLLFCCLPPLLPQIALTLKVRPTDTDGSACVHRNPNAQTLREPEQRWTLWRGVENGPQDRRWGREMWQSINSWWI